jgi:hypothetical protein
MPRNSLAERIKRSPAQFAGERKEALEHMNAQLRKKITEIESMISDSRESTIRCHYEIGKDILDVRNNPQGKYGQRPMKQLEQAFGVAIRTLYKAAGFAESYTPTQLDAVIALRGEGTDFALNYQHIVYLLALPTKEKREKFAQMAVNNMWDPKDLMRAVQKYKGKSKYAGPGRKHKLPKTVAKQIRQILDMTRAWHTKYTLLWNGTGEEDANVFANVMVEPEENLHAEDLDMLLALRDLLPEVSREAKEMQRLAGKAVTRVEKILNSRKAEDMVDASHEAPPAREQRAIDIGSAAPTAAGSNGDGNGNGHAEAQPQPTERKRRRRRAAAAS